VNLCAKPPWPDVVISGLSGKGIVSGENKSGGESFDDARSAIQAAAHCGDIFGDVVRVRLGTPGEAIGDQRPVLRSASRRARQRSMISLPSWRMVISMPSPRAIEASASSRLSRNSASAPRLLLLPQFNGFPHELICGATGARSHRCKTGFLVGIEANFHARKLALSVEKSRNQCFHEQPEARARTVRYAASLWRLTQTGSANHTTVSALIRNG
jgi:hypothetical protein